ncbi:hypothetical protein CK203_095744 [Vitis vinifera]|uniref:Uncharacterized protein n=1 Tax=Vitis vinifera TaxID=29760 RepID=A0A438BQY7_VITVI|nr:hypothetical protein CK203_095744 [Vitis vinifera]
MAETTKLCILALGTFPGNLSSKELEGPFRKRKWCLQDFADTQEGLRNHFAVKGYSCRAAKLASILRFPASSLRHISDNFRRKYTILYKKAAKSLRNKRVISQHFAKCFLQLGVIDLQWLLEKDEEDEKGRQCADDSVGVEDVHNDDNQDREDSLPF